MPQYVWVIIAIAVLVVLVAVFVLSFLLYVKTPAPKGCEKKPSELCSSCPNSRCEFQLYEPKGDLKNEKEEKENENEHNPD